MRCVFSILKFPPRENSLSFLYSVPSIISRKVSFRIRVKDAERESFLQYTGKGEATSWRRYFLTSPNFLPVFQILLRHAETT